MPRKPPQKPISNNDIEIIQRAAAAGCTWPQIAAITGKAVRTLQKWAGDAYKQGRAQAACHAGHTMYSIGVGQIDEERTAEAGRTIYYPGSEPYFPALRFYLATQCGWREDDDRQSNDPPRSFAETFDARLKEARERLLASGTIDT